jgi:hypothetical protein
VKRESEKKEVAARRFNLTLKQTPPQKMDVKLVDWIAFLIIFYDGLIGYITCAKSYIISVKRRR